MTTQPLLPHQTEAATTLANRERFGLFDEMGVGKTASAIGALDEIGALRVLVVCPAAVRQVWFGEFKKFGRLHRRVAKGQNVYDVQNWKKGACDVLILSYEGATAWATHIDDLFEVLVLDEAHYLKSPKARRTRAMLGTFCAGENGIGRWAGQVWFLTGTPAPNDPIDIWPFLRFTKATTMNLTAFTTRYFRTRMGTFGGKQTPRQELMPELRGLIESVSMRRTKQDVGLRLPPIWFTTISVDGDADEIRALLSEHEGLEEAVLDAIERGGLSNLDAPHVSTLRKLVGQAKAPAAAQVLIEEMRNGLDKVVVMACHVNALRVLRTAFNEAGIKSVMIDGSVSEADRVEAVRAFQEDADCRVFLGNVRAAGTGLTLTASAEIVMLESSWSPAENAQAIMRVHRLGQNRSVRARFISLADSIDVVVSETVARKTAAIAQMGLDFGTQTAA